MPAYGRAVEGGSSGSRESVRRMFERDKDELRTAGIPIETERMTVSFGTESADGYRLRARDFYLPRVRVGAASDEHRSGRSLLVQPFDVAAEDLEVTLAALREAADIPDSPFAADTRSALRKLSFDLDPVVMDSPVLRADGSETPDLQVATELLSDALLRRKRVTFSYHSPAREQPTDRDVAVYGLMFERGAWYLVGYDALRGDIRVFRVDRMKNPVLNRKRPGTADYEIPTGFSLAAYRDRRAWQFGDGDESVAVRVRFSHPLCLWADRNRFGSLEESEGSKGAVRSFEVYGADPFINWILGLGGGAEILSPLEFVSRLCARAEAIRVAHEGEYVHGR